jgi:hypothetical protein
MSGLNSTANETCYDLNEVPEGALALHATLIAVIIAATLLGNGVILLLVARYKVLRSHSVIANLSLTFADVFWCFFYHFPALVSASSAGWLFGETGCAAFGILSVEFLLTRWLVMAVVCVDRFSTVRFPFSYAKYSKCLLLVLTTAAWILPFILALLPVVSKLSQEEFRPNIPTCLFQCENQICRLYYGLIVSLSFVIGAVIPTGLYIWLYRRARSLRPTAVVLGHMALQTVAGPDTNQPLSPSHHDRWSREIHGYITFILILVTFMATAAPAYLSQIFRTTDYEDWCKAPIFVHFVIQLIFLSSTALDPLVIMRDQDFRRCLKHMLCCGRQVDPSLENIVPQASNLHRTSLDLLSVTTNGTTEVPHSTPSTPCEHTPT